MSEENAVQRVEAPEEKRKPAALALKRDARGTRFNNVEEALSYATACFRSGMLPEHIKNAQQAFVIMDNGAELGLRPWASWKGIYITKHGRISMQSKTALAVAQASPRFDSYDEYTEFEGTGRMRAVAVGKKKGQKEPTIKTFSLQDAEKAGLLVKPQNRRGEEYDGTYQKFLKDMLTARARDRCLTVCFAAELAGIELETMAEDADRAEAEAEGTDAGPVKPTRQVEKGEEPKSLPPAQADPLLQTVLGKQAAPTQPPEVKKPPEAPKKPEIDRSVDEALGDEKPEAEPEGPQTKQCQECGTLYHASRDACPECPPKGAPPEGEPEPPKEEAPEWAVGDIIHTSKGARRVLELDNRGRPAVVEQVSAKELKALEESEKEESGPTHCPRDYCGAKLNLIGQCDACGWPTANYGE